MRFTGNRLFAAILIYILILIFSGCAPKQLTTIVYIPAGVDTTIAEIADSIAKELFVEWKNEQLANRLTDSAATIFKISDSLLTALRADTAQKTQTSAEDSVKALKKLIDGARVMKQIKGITANRNLSTAEKRAQIQNKLEAAKPLLEQAISLNPFDRRARNVLSQVYQNLGKLFAQEHYWGKSIEVLSKLVFMDQSQHSLFARLGNAYMRLNSWEKALKNYQIAEEVLQQSAIYQVPQNIALTDSAIAATLDSTKLFAYVFRQAICTMRLYREPETFALLEKGMRIAQNEANRELIQDYYDWAMWDDGNLETTDRRDTLLAWVGKKRFDAAAQGMELLLPNLRTKRAAQEIKWRLARLRFARLSREESGLNLMKEIIDFYQHDSTGMALAKEDSMLLKYQDAFGTMCYNVGAKCRDEERDRVKALKYFMQSAAIPWGHQAKAWLAVAQLSIQNPARSEKAALEALALESQLNDKEYASTMEILISALRLQRKTKEASKRFKEWQALVRK